MNEKYIILTAQVISIIFTPFYLPMLAFIVLFMFSYLNLMGWGYKLYILAMIYLFTVLLPYWSIYAYRKLNGWTRHQMGQRERRYVPYAISIVCYSFLLYLMNNMHMPSFTLAVIVAALSIQVVCALVNAWIKISTHAASSGAIVGALMAFSLIFSFDPTPWLCLSVMICGAVCTSRLILRQHTLGELGLGCLLGAACGWFSVMWSGALVDFWNECLSFAI